VPEEPRTVIELQKDHESAANYFRRALQADPDLSEAHFALALYLQKKGDFATALTHLDEVKRRRGSAVLMAPVQAHRIELLFQTGDFSGAFREITNLLEQADKHKWIWPSCARQVGTYGRLSIGLRKAGGAILDGLRRGSPERTGC